MRIKAAFLGGAIGVVAFGVGACSSDPMPVVEQVEATTTTTATTTTSLPVTSTTEDPTNLSESAITYFEDIAVNRPTDSAEPGSPADLYARYLVESRLTYGPATEPTTVMPGPDSVTLRTAGEGDIVVDEIKVSTEGVVDFAIDGTPMSERISSAEPTSAEGIDASGLIYRSVSGVRVIMIEATNTREDADLLLFWESDFTSITDGRQESPMDASTPEIAPGATAVAMYQFDEIRSDTSGEFLLSYAHHGPGETYSNPPRLAIPFP